MAHGTIQKISMAELLMTQHKSRSAYSYDAQWLERDSIKGALSGAAVFEMVAEPAGIPNAMRGGFCRWVLVLIAIFSVDQLDNSKSKMRTSEMNLDGYPRMGSTGFAGLAGYSLCMLPGRMYEAETHCSAVDHFIEVARGALFDCATWCHFKWHQVAH